MTDQQIVREWDPAVGKWVTKAQAEAGGGGSQTLAEVLVEGSDADGSGISGVGTLVADSYESPGPTPAKLGQGLNTDGAAIATGGGQIDTSFGAILGGAITAGDGGTLTASGSLTHTGAEVGFYGTNPVAKQTGVAVTAEAIHAALVDLGLIAA